MLRLLRRKQKNEAADELRELIGAIELPSFPAAILESLQRVRDDESTNHQIADSISVDPGLTAKVLGTVNSSSFGLRNPVNSVLHAITLIGRSELESTLISIAVRKALPREPGRGFVPSRFWIASARRATTARALAGRLDPSSESECFTAALLQDMAVPLLVQRRGDEYGTLLERWHRDEPDLAALEQGHFGWDHARIGKLMASMWHFPKRLVQAIEWHHTARADGGKGLVPVNLVAALREGTDTADVERLVEQASERHGLSRDETLEVVGRGFAEADSIARLFA